MVILPTVFSLQTTLPPFFLLPLLFPFLFFAKIYFPQMDSWKLNKTHRGHKILGEKEPRDTWQNDKNTFQYLSSNLQANLGNKNTGIRKL